MSFAEEKDEDGEEDTTTTTSSSTNDDDDDDDDDASNSNARAPKVGTSYDVKLVQSKKKRDDATTLRTKSNNTNNNAFVGKKKLMALRYTRRRAPAADVRKPVRVVRKKGVVEVEFMNVEEEKSGIRYRGVMRENATSAATKSNLSSLLNDARGSEKEIAPAEEGEINKEEQENGDADSDDGDVECAILFNGKNIELRVLDETVAGLRVQRKREEEEESGMVSKRLDIGDAAGVRNKRKKVV